MAEPSKKTITVIEQVKNDYIMIQSLTTFRSELATLLRGALVSIPICCTKKQINKELTFNGTLGKGAYGTIYQVILKDSTTIPYPFALKRIIIDPKGSKKSQVKKKCIQALYEAVVMNYASNLVLSQCCPNFVVTFHICHQLSPNNALDKRFLDIVMEESDGGSLDCWSKREENEYHFNSPPERKIELANKWLSILFQVFVSFAWVGRIYDLVHNDAYFKNILVTQVVPDITYRYIISDWNGQLKTFDVPLLCNLVKLTDFGIARSDKISKDIDSFSDYNHISRQDDPSLKSVDIGSLASIGKTTKEDNHIVFYNLPPFSRDIITVLSSVLNTEKAPLSIRQWASESLEEVERQIKSNRKSFNSPEIIPTVMHFIFDSSFLARSLKIDKDMDTKFLERKPEKEPNQIFTLPF